MRNLIFFLLGLWEALDGKKTLIGIFATQVFMIAVFEKWLTNELATMILGALAGGWTIMGFVFKFVKTYQEGQNIQ
jgi:hypothetical protein